MKEVLGRFAILDFMGYLFPGVVGLTGCYVALRFTDLIHTPARNEPGVLEVLLMVVFSYVFGVVSSGFSWPFYWFAEKTYLRWMNRSDPRGQIYPQRLAAAIQQILQDRLGFLPAGGTGSEEDRFYLSSSLVVQCLPQQTALASRQNALRVLRQYMLPPLAIWTFVGVLWGLDLKDQGNDRGWVIVLGSIVVGFLAMVITIERLWKNRRREVREIYMALVVGEAVGTLSRSQATPPGQDGVQGPINDG